MSRTSALVSAYYAAEFLEDRLENLIHAEVVVVCLKGSEEMEIAKRYPCAIVPTDDIPTLYKAWNMAIEKASGEYLTSANCDDRFYPGALEVMEKHLDENPCALVYGDCDRQEGDSVYLWKRRDAALGFCTVGAMPLWRKSLHKKYGYFDEGMKVAGDYDFWMRLIHSGERLDHIPYCTGLYRARADSLEHRLRDDYAIENQIVRERYAN